MSRYRLDNYWPLELNHWSFTFIVVHIDAMPAEDVSACRHLWSPELLLQTDSASQLVATVVSNLLDLVPLLLFYALE